MTQLKCTDLYRHKLNEAKRLIDTHNYLRKPTLNDNRVVYSEFLQKLADIGGTCDERLYDIKAEDLEKVCGLPTLMARRLALIFQERKES